LPNVISRLAAGHELAQERAGTFFCGGIRKSKKDEQKDEANFDETYYCVCGAVHISVFRDERARGLRGRLLHYQRRAGSARLRLSDHGDMPGRIRRHRRHMFARWRFDEEPQRCDGLSTEAAAATRGDQPKSTRIAVIG
jgi:hypothetical protein